VRTCGYNEIIVCLKGHGAKQALENINWIQRWEPSVTTATKNECELLLSGVPKMGTAEETAKAIYDENGPGYMGLKVIRASWWGKTWQDERKTERQSMRLVIDNAKIANRLIDNALGLRAIRIKVRRFQPSKGRRRSYYFYEEDSPESSQVVPSSQNEEEMEIEEEERGSKRKAEGTGPKPRGRPFGALNKSDFHFGSSQGEHPWGIASQQAKKVAAAQEQPQPQPESQKAGEAGSIEEEEL
jgi:hypothetical protein